MKKDNNELEEILLLQMYYILSSRQIITLINYIEIIYINYCIIYKDIFNKDIIKIINRKFKITLLDYLKKYLYYQFKQRNMDIITILLYW